MAVLRNLRRVSDCARTVPARAASFRQWSRRMLWLAAKSTHALPVAAGGLGDAEGPRR